MMTDLNLDIWNEWIRKTQEGLEDELSNTSPVQNPYRYYRLTGYIEGMIKALAMLTTIEEGQRCRSLLDSFRQNLLASGAYDANGNYMKNSIK